MLIRMCWAKLAFGAVLAAVVVGPITSAVAQQTSDQVRVAVNLKDADMLIATQTLTKLSGLQFVVEPTDTPFGKITLQLNDVTAEDAIRYICTASGAFFRRDENGVYIISRTKPGSDSVNNTAQPPVRPAKLIKRIRLMKADPKTVYDFVMFGQPPDMMRPYQELNRLNETTNQPKGSFMVGKSFDPVVPFNGKQFQNPNSESGNGIQLPGEGGGQIGFGGGGGGQGFGGGGQGLGGGQGQGGQGQGGGFGQGGQGGGQLIGGQGLVPQGIDFISYDPTDNSFIVQGTDEAIQEFIRILNEFDVAPRQVQIKVEFITVTSSVSKSLGFEFGYARGEVSAGVRPGTFARSGDPIFLNFGAGNISARMRAQLLTGFGKVVNAPTIRTLNNQPASIQSTVNTTIFISQSTGVGNGQVIVTSVPLNIPVGTGLSVTPRINNDGTITMALSPSIGDFGQLRRSPDGQEIPDRTFQTINVVARVRNNETIVLGGFTRKQDTGSESRIPILGDLPIIGQFFRSRTNDKNQSELLIFVTPTIIEDDEGSGINP